MGPIHRADGSAPQSAPMGLHCGGRADSPSVMNDCLLLYLNSIMPFCYYEYNVTGITISSYKLQKITEFSHTQISGVNFYFNF